MASNMRLLASSVVFLQLAALLALVAAEGPQISNLNLLLPPRATHPVRYRLAGSNGCFDWSTDHGDLLDIEPEYNSSVAGCSTSVTISSKAPYAGRRTTAVHAKDRKTGRVLRCEVVIDKISRIAIFHTVLKIDLEGLATLQIRAFDAEDNVFSSLIGLQFAWTFNPLRADGKSHRLRHVPLKETALSGCGCDCGDVWVRINIEEGELWSDLFVVKGIEAGKERVSAQLVEPGFPSLDHDVVLTVAEAFSLLPPSPVHIIPGTKLEYSVLTFRPDRLEGTPVSLPSPFYTWTIDNSTVASIDPQTGHVLAHTLGQAHVTVTDVRVEDYFQTSLLKVVIPTRLVLSLQPLGGNAGLSRSVSSRALQKKKSDGSWQIVEGRKYLLQVAAYSKDSGKQPLVLSEDVDLRLSFDNIPAWITRPVSETEAVEQGWANATVLEALQEGAGSLSAALIFGNMVKDPVSDDWVAGPQSVLEAAQEVRVCAPVELEREELRLPWLPGGAQEYTLKAYGGCDAGYTWFSEDPSIATVDPSGTIRAVGPGRTQIFAAAAFDELNSASTVVTVSVPASLQHETSLRWVDLQVGEAAPATVKLLDADGHEYDNCTAAACFTTWHVVPARQGDPSSSPTPLTSSAPASSDLNTLHNSWDQLPSRACASHVFWGVAPGPARVSAVLDFDLEGSPELRREIQERSGGDNLALENAPRKLAAQWTVTVYAPLVLERADNGTAVGGLTVSQPGVITEVTLVPGSTVKVRTRGGPDNRGVEGFLEQARVRGQGVKVQPIGRPDIGGMRTYEVTCTELGTQLITFDKGVAQANLTVRCSLPKTVVLVIDEPVNSLSVVRTFVALGRESPRMQTIAHQVINNRLIRVAAVALDQDLNPFSSAASLTVDWDLEGCEGAQWASLAELEPGLDAPAPSGWERGLSLGNRSGKCVIRATAVGLHRNHEKVKVLTRKVVHEVENEVRGRSDELTDGATLQLVSALRLEPRFALLLSHPEARVTFKVLGGTSDVQAASNDTTVAGVASQPAGKTLHVAPTGLGLSEIRVKDMGLEHPTIASAVVVVTDVASVKVLVSEDLLLQVGSNLTVAVEAADDQGRPFAVAQLPLLNLAVHLSDETVALLDVPAKAPNEFIIRGSNVGTTLFHVSVRSVGGKIIESKFVRVSLYAPLALHPSELFLAPGVDYAVQIQGGPSSNVQVTLSSSDAPTASVDSILGLVRGQKEGQATITAVAKSASGQVLSEAVMTVVVKKLVKAGLHVGSGRLGVGEEIDVFPEGGERGEDLMSFGQVCYEYRWSVGDQEVLSVQDAQALEVPESRRGNALAEQDPGFSARLVGKTPGKTSVSLTFRCRYGPPGTPPVQYSASADILVVDNIPVNRGCCATWLLPPHYETTFTLPYYQCCGPETTTYSLLQHCPPPNQDDNYVVKLLDEGGLQTGSRPDVECIYARVRSTGRAGLAACVKVAEIAEITVGDNTPSRHYAELSVGASQSFSVTARDEFGFPFFEAAHVPFHVEANHPDIVAVHVEHQLVPRCEVQVTQTQVVVKALKQGTALIRIHVASNPDIVDFVVVRVGAYVTPREPVMQLGSSIRFAAGLADGSREEGKWSSRDLGVVKVDQFSGEATAVGPGSTTVHFNGSHLTTYTTVTVVPVAAVSLKHPAGVPFLTNAHQGAEYAFPVIFKDADVHDIGPPAAAAVAPFECHVAPSYLGHAHSRYNESTREAFCIVHVSDPESIAHSRADAQQPLADRTGTVEGTVRADVSAIGNAPAVLGQPERFRFVGAFALASGTPQELYLYKSTNRTIVSLVGDAADVTASWDHRGAVAVRRVSKKEEAAGLSGRALYEIKLLQPGSSLSDRVTFKSDKTGQTVELPFHYDAGGTPVLGYTLLSILAAVIGAITIATTRLLWAYFARRRPPAAPAPARGAQNPQTPEPPTPAPPLDAAQTGPRMRTPPEVARYAERTIERTPGYRTSPLSYAATNGY